MKKTLSTLIALLFVVVTCVPASVSAATVQPRVTRTITAVGVLDAVSEMEYSVLDGQQLSFNSDGSVLAVTSEQEVKVTFNATRQIYQGIILHTNNTQYTGTGSGAGLIGEQNTTKSVPLYWTVWATYNDANGYTFDTYPQGTTIPNPNYVDEQTTPDQDPTWDVSGQIDPTYQPYVVDGALLDLTTQELDYSSPIWDVQGLNANLASAPVDAAGQDPDENNPNFRTVSNGEAYLKFATDYHNADADTYSATIILDLVTIS